MRTPQKNTQNKPVRVRRRLYPNCFALSEVVGMLTALGYTVKVV